MLDDNQHLDEYEGVDDYKAKQLELDEDYIYEEDMINDEGFLNKTKLFYRCSCGVSASFYFSNDKDEAIFQLVDSDAIYSFDEALENLQSNYVNEDLVIALLT